MAEHIVKPCKVCGRPMQIKRNRATSEEFLGCSMWPECTHTEPLPEAIKLRRQGYQDMFEADKGVE
jgi:ssDNA-binding Zn-finger/Zn-ribbon topoisomerase 1